jgi:hypothetical protein
VSNRSKNPRYSIAGEQQWLLSFHAGTEAHCHPLNG